MVYNYLVNISCNKEEIVHIIVCVFINEIRALFAKEYQWKICNFTELVQIKKKLKNLICFRKKFCELKDKVPQFIRLYNRLDFNVLGDLLSDLDWTTFDESEDVDIKMIIYQEFCI